MTTYENYAEDMGLNLPEAIAFAKLYFKAHCKYSILDEYNNPIQNEIAEENLSASLADAIDEYSSETISLIAYVECPLEVVATISGGILA